MGSEVVAWCDDRCVLPLQEGVQLFPHDFRIFLFLLFVHLCGIAPFQVSSCVPQAVYIQTDRRHSPGGFPLSPSVPRACR